MIKQHAGFSCSTARETTEYKKYPRKYHGHDERNDCYMDIQIPVKTLKIFNLKNVVDFHTNAARSCLNLTSVKCNINK
jgi:hypothetical protein